MNRAGLLLYRPLASPLHATRAGVAALWALALTAATLLLYHPLALAALVLAVLGAGWGAGVGRELTRALRMALIVGLPIVAVNVLVSREGLTVFARLGDLGPFGQGDLTVEALVFGAVVALKVTILILASALASLAVDPDALLRIFRRLSFRSALTASLAVRMIPVLAADAHRLAEAQRTRPGGGTAGGSPSGGAAGRAAGGARGASRCSARCSPARSTARWTSPPRSSSAASPPPHGPRGCSGRGRATTSPSPPPGRPSSRSRCSPDSAAPPRSPRTRWCTRPSASACARSARRLCSRSCCRSATAGGSSCDPEHA